jgi:hypothetical protein
MASFSPIVRDSPTLLSTDWMWDLSAWNLMEERRPVVLGFYNTFAKDADPQYRLLRWTGENWVAGATPITNITAWCELEESSDDEEEINRTRTPAEDCIDPRWRG